MSKSSEKQFLWQSEKNLEALLQKILAAAVQMGFSYAAYRQPLIAVHQQAHDDFSLPHNYYKLTEAAKNLQLVFSAEPLKKIPLSQLRQAPNNFVGYAFNAFQVFQQSQDCNTIFQFLAVDVALNLSAFTPFCWVRSGASGAVHGFAATVTKIVQQFQQQEGNVQTQPPVQKIFYYEQPLSKKEKYLKKDTDKDITAKFAKKLSMSTSQKDFTVGVNAVLQLIKNQHAQLAAPLLAGKNNRRLSNQILNDQLLNQPPYQPLIKVVLSAVKSVKRMNSSSSYNGEHNKNTQVVVAFVRALKSCPFAMVSLFSSPQTGTWFTASPEVLSSLNVEDGRHIFRTVSLAGTQKSTLQLSTKFNTRNGNAATQETTMRQKLEKLPYILKNARWSAKEIEEQALVNRYIVDAFKKIRLRAYIEKGPRTVIAGKVLHLASTFFVDATKHYGAEILPDMLGLLHPTSAVAGFPKKKALQAIEKLEKHSRSYYAGFFGPWGIANALQAAALKKSEAKKNLKKNLPIGGLLEANLYVNIRTAKIYEGEIVFYGGAGIVRGSVAEDEWREVQLKMKTMQNFF